MKQKLKKLKKARPIQSYLIAAARKIWLWSPERREAIANASLGPDLVECKKCKKLLPKFMARGKKKLFAVDHIDPVVLPSTGFLNWDEYYARLFVPANKLQILCHSCHEEKTEKENNERGNVRERKRSR